MRLLYSPILAGICLWPALAAAQAIPDCAGHVEIARGAVTRVERDGVLVLERGRAVALEGIRLPLGEADRAPPALADQAYVTLTRLVGEGPVTLAVTPPRTDRYDRLRAQGFAPERAPEKRAPVFGKRARSFDMTWLQQAMLERGLARVAIAPDRGDCAPDLYEAEAMARKAGRGLWALPAYRVRGADAALKNDAGTFQVVEGVVANVGSGAGRTFLDFSADWRQGFSAIVAGEDRKVFRRAGFDLAALRGRRIRLRGMVEDFGGRPEIALSNPAQIELMD